jgi:nitroreductase
MITNAFSEAMQFRHACKRFEILKKIDDTHMRFILEAGRMSPSSFGQEPWRFLVVRSDDLKEKLRPLCWNQPQITEASHIVIILAAIENVRPRSGIPAQRFARRPLPPEAIAAYNETYATFLKDTFATDEKTFCWTARQCYIALANMLTAAASVGIDSCPIEGFEKEKIEALLDIDTAIWQVAVIAAFGYRAQPQGEHLRLPFEEVVRYLD